MGGGSGSGSCSGGGSGGGKAVGGSGGKVKWADGATCEGRKEVIDPEARLQGLIDFDSLLSFLLFFCCFYILLFFFRRFVLSFQAFISIILGVVPTCPQCRDSC